MEMFGNNQYEFQFESQKLVVWSHDGLLFVFSVKISLAEHKRICKREGTQGRPRCWGGGSSRRGHWRRAWPHVAGAAQPGFRIPPEPEAIFQGGSEPAKTLILQQVLDCDKTPQI